jgi:hypothetical protein
LGDAIAFSKHPTHTQRAVALLAPQNHAIYVRTVTQQKIPIWCEVHQPVTNVKRYCETPKIVHTKARLLVCYEHKIPILEGSKLAIVNSQESCPFQAVW